ncbi:putative terpene synthase family protein [Botrytis fragariae]|uniref:Putative terpene synthase family protein n=1 Tax=Botrytis fragariae TaxID=1964551 RepID=A0A8H6B1L7_9HELO|nr:putative terpene synthase family protein [Botrytis fragariae]KAF5877460.1 putative terpene synthase family protein [Botrytis fragariae]
MFPRSWVSILQSTRQGGKSLESVNFPEFEKCAGTSMSFDATEKQTTAELQEKKSALMEMAEYERECLLIVKARLRPLAGEKVRGVLDVFVDVTDLYGQIYVARDIATRPITTYINT